MKLGTWLTGATVAGAAVVALSGVARADDQLAGDFYVTADQGALKTGADGTDVFVSGQKADVRLAITRRSDGTYAVRRSVTYPDGRVETWGGVGRLARGQLKVSFRLGAGISDVVGSEPPADPNAPSIAATYGIAADGKIWGSIANAKRSGGWSWAKESGLRAGTRVASAKILRPAAGAVFAAGQVVDVATDPPGAAFTVSGAGRIAPGNKLQLTGAGETTIQAGSGQPVKVRAVALDVTLVNVEGALPLVDSQGPQLERALGAEKPSRSEPAAILKGDPLRLTVVLRAKENLTSPAKLRIVARSGSTSLAGEATFSALAAGERISLATVGPLSTRVTTNLLALEVQVQGTDASYAASSAVVPLRVWTVHKPPVNNIANDRAKQFTKLHVQLACDWANDAGKNIGNGAESIGWNIDNRMRHHVHPVDYKPGVTPPFLAYALTATPPKNYQDLSGSWEAKASGLDRGINSLYYPPLEVHKPYENYTNYASNFGWWVLDNPDYVGGRCNQQASLIAQLLGTVGMKARVFYLERTGISKGGRPCRQYFYAAGGSGPWNFHGLCAGTMDDGTEWLYDGCFSSPPNRLNGLKEWATAAGNDKPFIQKWGPWLYEDTRGGPVAAGDIPTKWNGIP